jgi:hypothetical protein
VLRALESDIERHGIETRVELASKLPPVIGHKGQLQEVIINLVQVKTFPPDLERAALAAATRDCRDRPSSNRGNHGPIVSAPVAPHIAGPVPAGFATQTVSAVTVTAIAVTGSTTEAAANVIAAKTITSATVAPVSSASECLCISRKKAAGKSGTC